MFAAEISIRCPVRCKKIYVRCRNTYKITIPLIHTGLPTRKCRRNTKVTFKKVSHKKIYLKESAAEIQRLLIRKCRKNTKATYKEVPKVTYKKLSYKYKGYL